MCVSLGDELSLLGMKNQAPHLKSRGRPNYCEFSKDSGEHTEDHPVETANTTHCDCVYAIAKFARGSRNLEGVQVLPQLLEKLFLWNLKISAKT